MAKPEERARQLIDAQLVAAGWVIRDRDELNLGAELLDASLQRGQIAAEAARDWTSAARDLLQAVIPAAFRGDLLNQ